jgi:hypothetical protein
MRSYGFGHRVATEVLIGLGTTGGFVLASRSSGSGAAWLLIFACLLLVLVATLAGYYEPSASRVWMHPPLMMALELIALPASSFTCRGFECGGVIAFLHDCQPVHCILVGFSYVGFALRRRVLSSRASPLA